MLPLKLEDVSVQAIKALVENGLRETRTLEFKRDQLGVRDEDKREFLADVSALANTAGGDLIFGVEEANGEAIAVPGLRLSNPDDEMRRLESLLLSGLEPRLPKVDVKWLADGDIGCIFIRVPRSYVAPHRVTLRDHGKFYGRNSSMKYALDVTELRFAFLSNEGLTESIRRFHRERLAAIEGGEAALPVRGTTHLVLHAIPLSAFSTAAQIEVGKSWIALPPLGSTGGFNGQHTLEGYATYSGKEGAPEGVRAYTQLFRSGVIEGVATIGFPDQNKELRISPSDLEGTIIAALGTYIEFFRANGLEPPIYLFVTLLGVRGYKLTPRQMLAVDPAEQRKDVVMLPELVLDGFIADAKTILRPTFDLFWNAFGYAKSYNYDDSGRYIPRFG